MAMTRREFLVNSLAVGTMSLVSHLDPARRLRGAASESDVLAFTHVTVIDATGRPALPEQTVLVKGDRIAAVEKFGKLKLPDSAKVIDARGMHMIPGLWDMHAHARGTPALLSDTLEHVFLSRGPIVLNLPVKSSSKRRKPCPRYHHPSPKVSAN